MGSIRFRNFRVAALSLACVVIPASAVAASADYFLKLDGVDGESKDAKHKGEIEIQSFSWGATQRAGGGQADALTDGLLILRNTAPPASGAAGGSGGMGAAKTGGTGLGKGKASMSDLSVMRGPRQTTSLDGVNVAAGDVDGDGRANAATGKYGAVSGVRRDDGLAGDKRTHPALIKISKPLDTGSITVKMKLPGCAVGKRYSSGELSTPSGRYALHDVVVASCGGGAGGSAPMEQVTLNYTKVQVRGWNPEKKED